MSPLLGGKSERAVDDHATQLAHFAVGEIAAKANAPDLSLVRVTKLSTQVGRPGLAGLSAAAGGCRAQPMQAPGAAASIAHVLASPPPPNAAPASSPHPASTTNHPPPPYPTPPPPKVVAGIKYYFTLEAKDKGGATRHYEAQVWEKPVRGRSRAGAGRGVEAGSRGRLNGGPKPWTSGLPQARRSPAALAPGRVAQPPASCPRHPHPQGGYENSAPELTGYKELSEVSC
jgi:hypothetical protein